MTAIIASILGLLTGGVATFFWLKLQSRKSSTADQPTSAPISSAPEAGKPPTPAPPSPAPAPTPVTAAPSEPVTADPTPVTEAAAVVAADPEPIAVEPAEAKATPDPVAAVVAESPVESIAPNDSPGEPTITELEPDTTPEPVPIAAVAPVQSTPSATPLRHYLDPETELLSYRVASWRQAAYVPQLVGYAQHPNHQVRKAVAIALGEIAANGSLRGEESRAVTVLAKLSRDSISTVREAAVAALGQVKSRQAIAPLQQALRDCDQDVVRLASAALQKFKYYPVAKPKGLAKNR